MTAPRLRTGLSPEKSEALLNWLRFFHFPTAPVSFVAAYRSLFAEGMVPVPENAGCNLILASGRGRTQAMGRQGPRRGVPELLGQARRRRSAPKKVPEGKKKVGSISDKGVGIRGSSRGIGVRTSQGGVSAG